MSRQIDKGFRAFSELDVEGLFASQRKSITEKVHSKNDDYILNIDREEFTECLVSEHIINPLTFHEKNMSVKKREALVPAEQHPFEYDQTPGKSYKRDILDFFLPFEGDEMLLRVSVNIYSTCPIIDVIGQEVLFSIIHFTQTPEEISRQKTEIVQKLNGQNDALTDKIRLFNTSLRKIVADIFDARKSKLQNSNDLLSALDVPIRKADNVPSTFSIPIKRKQLISGIEEPSIKKPGSSLTPSLGDKAYHDILQCIHDLGKQIERHPSTYSGKNEETIRDYFLMVLEPHFIGSATGETFNKSGKTDILLRYKGNNVFIAELKYWRGAKSLLDTFTQLLSYLTWRDSKAAVVVLVKNQNLSSVLESARNIVSEHGNFISHVDDKTETWFRYKFHIDGDFERLVDVSLMFYHLPEGVK